MNRIYQGRAAKAELIDDKGNPLSAPENWDGLDALWQHHALFQDAVNYYLVCLHQPSAIGYLPLVIRRRRGGLRDSVAKYLTPDNNQPTSEECFAQRWMQTRSTGNLIN